MRERLSLPELTFRYPNRVAAYEVAGWRYEARHARWNMAPQDATRMLSAEHAYVLAVDPRGSIVGMACTGAAARVAGGEYSAAAPRVLDVHVRLRPSLIGRGMGAAFVHATCGWLQRQLQPRYFRATIAADDALARHLLESLGFREVWRFVGQERTVGRIQHYLQFEVAAMDLLKD